MMRPKYLYLTILFFAISDLCSAQAPSWQWAKGAIGNEYDQASGIAADAAGNTYTAGYFASDSILFGNHTIVNNTFGFDDMFIVKHDAQGNVQWAHGAGGNFDDKANAVATDASGNVYVVGQFASSGITFGTYTLNNTGPGDIFIVKYDNAGNVLWAKREGGPALDIAHAVDVDASGNIVVAGRFSSLSITFGSTTLTQAGSMDGFVVKYDPAGNALWAKGIGGGSNDEAYAAKYDGNGNVFVSGHFNQAVNFGAATLTSAGLSDMFIVKYDQGGTAQWAKKAGGSGDDRGRAVACDGSGNVYVAGFFASTSFTFGTTVLNSAGGDNSFLAKYDLNGAEQWANAANGDSRANGVAAFGSNIYICGNFSGASLNYGSSALTGIGSTDLYLAKCHANGTPVWAVKQNSGGSSGEVAYAASCDASGHVYIAGAYGSDPIVFGPSTLNNSSGYDFLIAKSGTGTTGLMEISGGDNSYVYPNPGNGIFTFVSKNKINSLRIYNVQCGLIYSKAKIEGHSLKADLSFLQGGIYFAKINETEVLKLIIQ